MKNITMTKTIDYKSIVERLVKIIDREEKVDKAYETYMKVKAPDSYVPISEDSCVVSFLAWIGCFDIELYDILSRWIWDCNRNGRITGSDYIEYVIDSPEKLVDYLNNQFNYE